MNKQKTLDGQTAKLISAVCEALPRSLNAKRVQELIDNPIKLKHCLLALEANAPTLQPLEFVFEVDYTIPFDQLLKDCGVVYATDEMRAMSFPVNTLPLRKKVKAVLLDMGRKTSASFANWFAYELEYRCASIRELVCWSRLGKGHLGQFPVAATGESVHSDVDDLRSGDGQIYIFLHLLTGNVILDHIGSGEPFDFPLIDRSFEKQFRFLLVKPIE
ncbi:MAG: hypothetical protein Q7R65_01605 [bacterium]|nr:hypothetical protein [bacterium]